MKLRQYLKELNELVKQYPEFLDLECVYSSDDEGNGYKKVNFTGSPMQFEDMDEWELELVATYNEKYPEGDEDGDYCHKNDINAIVIN